MKTRKQGRISIWLQKDLQDDVKKLADQTGLSVNAYIQALLEEAVDSKAVVMLKPHIVREGKEKNKGA